MMRSPPAPGSWKCSRRWRAATDGPSYRDEVFAGLDPAELPRLAALAPRWATLTEADRYRDGLRALVAGLLP